MRVCVIEGIGSEKKMLNSKRLDNSKGYVIWTICYINIKELV